MDERKVLYRMQFQGDPPAEIARGLGRHRSTLGRECRRNAHPAGRYSPGSAQTGAHRRRRAPLRRPKTGHRRRMTSVGERGADGWSPEQIAGRLSARAPADREGLSISPTTLSRWIGKDPPRTQPFRPFLRIARKPRRKPYGKPSRPGQIAGKRSIDERPTEAKERQRLGDGEGDTVVGKGRQGFLGTCVDRASRYLIARKVNAGAAEPVARQLPQTIRQLPAEKRRRLTRDQGREFARPLELERKLDLPVYFAHPYHSWERGTNENTNGLLRQYLPKGTDLTKVTDAQRRSQVRALNHRPRKGLDCHRPVEVFPPQLPG